MSDAKENVFNYSDERVIVLSDRIDHSSVGQVCASIICWNRQDELSEREKEDFVAEPIRLYVQSFGGSVYDAWGLIDVIMTSRTPVYTYCFGTAMSAGFLIFLAGEKRFISKHATLHYHQISLWEGGKYQDIVEGHEESEWLQKRIEKYVIKRSRFTKDKLRRIRKGKVDYYIHAKESIKLGLVDEIIKKGGHRPGSKAIPSLQSGKKKKYLPTV